MRGRRRGPGWTSVNLSPRQIAEPGLVKTVATALERSGLPPGALSLEVTETALLEVSPSTARNVAALKELGVRLVLDDFGTGYSSLQHLRELPVDMVKIDRSFVANMAPAARTRRSSARSCSCARARDGGRGRGRRARAPGRRCCARWAARSRRASTSGARGAGQRA